jgi:hypothetical protein
MYFLYPNIVKVQINFWAETQDSDTCLDDELIPSIEGIDLNE